MTCTLAEGALREFLGNNFAFLRDAQLRHNDVLAELKKNSRARRREPEPLLLSSAGRRRAGLHPAPFV